MKASRWLALFLFGSWGLSFGAGALSAQSAEPALMPLPAHMTRGDGQFVIDRTLNVALDGYTEPRLVLARERFMATLFRETGIPVQLPSPNRPVNFTIKTSSASKPVEELGEDETYHLKVSSAGVELTASNPLGVLHGLQTFLQLVRITPQGFAAPAVTIDDEPRFAWRGLMIDSGRHFMPIPVIERNLDGMEAVKLNVFHWHISDDQGFRIESKVYPLLHEKGSNGLYYTQQQVKDVIDYARDRGIRVVPEFDMPCHTTSWFVGYPQLASGPGPYQVATQWGILDAAMDPTRESTFEFLDKFLGEMTALFPDAYFHVGGDECNGKEWTANQRIQAYMREHGIKDNAALQSYFSGRLQKLVAARHKIMEGWDEVLQPDTPKEVVIHSWRGPTALAVAAKQGNRGLLSNGYYIDLNQSAAYHYSIDPLGGNGASLSPEEKARVLGGEATMWSEMVTAENIDSRIWPRTAAIAERLWSPQDVKDVDSMYQRMAIISQQLQAYGLHHESFTRVMLQRMSGNPDPTSLQVLADVVQPPEGYQRESLKHYDTSSALNALVDAVLPESEQARKFSELVKAIVAGKASPQQWQAARACLVLLRDNDAKLQPSLERSPITAELVPLSHDLSQVATIGLRALDDLENHRVSSADLTQSNLQLLKDAEKPQAVLRNMIVAPVEVLVQAAGPPN
ncbi:MAG TPA: family 20 glycosylhydrolase, partial [Terracidiphilus sp.]|nr:family 20 glycosylhydrolase [Terracidiphilus sp.]